MNSVLEKKRIINRERQAKHLQDILTSSKFDMENNTVATVSKKCNWIRCKTCPSLIEGNEIHFCNSKTFKIKQGMNCVSKK
jgi:hypothetical protein